MAFDRREFFKRTAAVTAGIGALELTDRFC
jgi:hypothetical protein